VTRLDKVVRRETAVGIRDGGRSRPLLVELHPRHIELRQKGTRRRFSVSYDAIYDLAVKVIVRAQLAEKKKEGRRK